MLWAELCDQRLDRETERFNLWSRILWIVSERIVFVDLIDYTGVWHRYFNMRGVNLEVTVKEESVVLNGCIWKVDVSDNPRCFTLIWWWILHPRDYSLHFVKAFICLSAVDSNHAEAKRITAHVKLFKVFRHISGDRAWIGNILERHLCSLKPWGGWFITFSFRANFPNANVYTLLLLQFFVCSVDAFKIGLRKKFLGINFGYFLFAWASSIA